jgi:general secretion pathway protein A
MANRFTEWFGLTGIPFGKEIDGKSFLTYGQVEELHQILSLAIESRTAALVTGQAGTGKTTAVRMFAEQLPTDRHRVIYLGYDQTGPSMFARLAAEFGLKMSGAGTRILMLSQFIKRQIAGANRQLILIVDEAHLLEWRTLEDIRLLTNSEMDSKSVVTLILLGQLWLRSKLKNAGNEALHQRMRFRFGLEGVTKKQTKEYIKHHLALMGCTKELFTDGAVDQIFMASGGILREINNIATECLIKAANQSLPKVDERFAKMVIDQRETN